MAVETPPAADTVAPTVETPAVATGTASETPTGTASPVLDSAQVEPEASSFDISKWDGKVDALPEDLRVAGEAFTRFYQPKLDRVGDLESKLTEANRYKDSAHEWETLYKALSDGSEDPRIAQLSASVTERNAAAEAVKAEHEALKAKHEALLAEIEKTNEDAVKEQWEAFKAANPIVSKNVGLIKEIYEEGWELDQIPQLLELPKAQAAAARELAKGGTSPAVALELVTLRNANTKPEKPSTASVVTGAEHPTGNPAAMASGTYRKLSYSEKLDQTLARALR